MTGKDFHDPQLLLQGIRQMQNLHRQKTDYRFDMYQDIERKLAAIRENGIPLHPDFEKAYAFHKEKGVVCYENTAMGVYFISDPDGYWLEIVPAK